ncbi:hypothetical protein GCM10011583_08090 [Streptomyces camponoticapitis]|uniref:Hydrophobic protein n=1 Tax=Streptomyces camponoticapitis TaxID=1616125 RepID=A0ABQ2DZL6_9ACTN|nr:hypothetical protein [Streptomyces camponoticapitis]GGJ78880.1 hypothetical protein GCM10011583_08090 [Streptomyces camponoticapitis]
MIVVLLLIILALVLGMIGFVGEGLFFLLFIGVAVLFGAFVHAAVLWRRTGRRPVR